MEKKLNVLVVDDDKDVRMMLTEFLSMQGCLASAAADGLEAQKELNRNQGAYDLVITDFEMPGLNGLELIRFVRNNYPRTKTVFVTGRDEENIHAHARAAGAYETFKKPFDPFLRLKPVIENIKALKALESSA